MRRILLSFAFLFYFSFSNAEELLGFSVITTGASAGSLEAMVVDGGGYFTVRKLVHPAVLVEHPNGTLLWDTGLGIELNAQMESFSWADQQLFKVVDHMPARQQLIEAKYDISSIDMIVPSHMHWDHISGLEDFSPIPVWVQEASFQEASKGAPPAFVASQFDDPKINWEFITLEGGLYEGFEHSRDVFGDGSVVLVDTSGHSHGHLGMFVNLSDSERFFFIGDTTWVLEGVQMNRSRPWLIKKLVGVDVDFEKNANVVEQMHALMRDKPEIQFVPAHDERVVAGLPAFPEFKRADVRLSR